MTGRSATGGTDELVVKTDPPDAFSRAAPPELLRKLDRAADVVQGAAEPEDPVGLDARAWALVEVVFAGGVVPGSVGGPGDAGVDGVTTKSIGD